MSNAKRPVVRDDVDIILENSAVKVIIQFSRPFREAARLSRGGEKQLKLPRVFIPVMLGVYATIQIEMIMGGI